VYVSRGTPHGGAPDNFGPRLAAFEQVHLEPGESRPVELHLEPRLLSRWDIDAGAFRIAGGSYRVRIGAHALDEDGPAQTILLRSHLLR
jgi:beta-glucosidase